MAGQIASLPLSLQLDSNARPLSGCLLYLYAAGTSTPAVFYEDFATTIVLSWPLVGDTAGRIPMFWVTDGSYRVRLTDSQGNEIFDINSITAVGPSTGVVSGGGGGVSTSQIFSTGDTLWVPVDTTRSGWVRANGLTIGSSSSGASERANADCQSLFQYLWGTYANGICPVTGGRGATSLADWNANKRIGTIDMRSATAYGLDTMGNTAQGSIDLAVIPGGHVGSEAFQLTQAQLPNINFTHSLTAATHTHGAGTFAVGGHTHGAGTLSLSDLSIVNGTTVGRGLSLSVNTAANFQAGGGGASTAVTSVSLNQTSSTLSVNSGTIGNATASTTPTFAGTSAASGALAISGTVASGGTGAFLNTVSPGIAGTWFLKL